MERKRKILCRVSLVALFFLLMPLPSNAGGPTEQVQSTVERILAILRDPYLKGEAQRQERRAQLRRAISSQFDFTEMAKRSLGGHWRRRTVVEQEEFVRIFTDLLEHSYMDRIEAYHNEKFAYLGEKLEGDYAEIQSRIITQRGEEFAIHYRLHLVDGDWKVYDVVIENISLVNNYRSQFNRIITNSSFEELIRQMRDKQWGVVTVKK